MAGNQDLFQMKNEIGIVNFALSQLSIDPIPSFHEDTKIASEMRRNFQIAKETILREYVFDWAHRAEKLVAYTDAAGGYLKPADYLNFIGLGTCDAFCCCASTWINLEAYTHKASVREVNGRLYIQSCCCDRFEWFHYSFNNQNYTDIPFDLFETIAYKLAYMSCMQLTKDLNLLSFLRERTEDALSKARKHAGFENKQLAAHPDGRYPLRPKCGGFL